MDVLTNVLSTMRIASTLYARIDASAPWGIDFEVHQAIKFCLIAKGRCSLVLEGQQPLHLSEGDFVLTTRGAKYKVCDEWASPSKSLEEVLGESRSGVGRIVRIGGSGETATLLNGIMTFEELSRGYFTDLLPQLILIRRDQAQRLGFAVYMQQLAIEVEDGSPGAQLVANWLAGILFVHAVRAYSQTEGGRGSGWLAALSDRKITSALSAMHERIDQRWTVEELAAVAGMSRSGFAELFKTRVGKSPLEYLSDWRMHVAKGLLSDETQALSLIASRVGYESDTAFSKAFRKKTGVTPSEHRKRLKDGLVPT